MHRVLVPLVPLLFGTLAACADNGDEGILVTHAIAPGDDCTFSSVETEPALPNGALQIGGSYYIFPQMKSRITANSGEESQRTVIIQEANVDLTFSDETLFTAEQIQAMHDEGVTHFKSLFTVPLAPNGGIADGEFELIPEVLSDRLRAAHPEVDGATAFETQIVASFRVKGDMSGATVQSQPFQFAVRLTNGGLLNYVGTCPASGTIRTGNPCNVGQDFVTDCCGPSPTGPVTCPASM